MRLNDTVKKAVHDGYFMAGFGGKEYVQINKSVHVEITVDGDNVMNPATAIDVFKGNTFVKRYYVHSERECMDTLQRHK